MPKQYTFKTTRHTDWLEPILDSVPRNDRSMFIRELLIIGLESKGIGSTPSKSVIQTGSVTKDTQKSEVSMKKDTQKSDPGDTNDIQPVEKEVDVDELDRRLDFLGGIMNEE